jgi:hypothetical protein
MTESSYDASFQSWEEALGGIEGAIKKGGEFIFRADHLRIPELRTSFDTEAEKARIENTARWKYEAWILREFMRRAYHYLPGAQLPANGDKLEWLSLMRHYKAPSRLLDFTSSFAVALYFAMKGSTYTDSRQSCCVWVIDSKWLAEGARRIFGDWLRRNNFPDAVGTAHLRQPEMFTHFFLNYREHERCVIPITPFRMNERITRQRGLFLCPGDISVSFHENLQSMADYETGVRRVIMPADRESLQRVFRYFSQTNISSATLFPDLGGYAESLVEMFYRPEVVENADSIHSLEEAIKYNGLLI